jgi:hypothetical protein
MGNAGAANVTEGMAAGNATQDAGKGKGKGKNNGNEAKGKGNKNNDLEQLLQQAEAALQAGGQQKQQGGGLLESLGLGNLGGLFGGADANAGKAKNNAGDVLGAGNAQAGQAKGNAAIAAGGLDLSALGIGRKAKRTASTFRA